MATSLSIDRALVQLLWTFTKTENWGDSTTQSSSFTFSSNLANGVIADTADRLYVNKTTITAGGNTVLDLAGSLTDVFGSSITFVRVKAFYFELTTDTTATSVTIGAAGSAPAPLWFGDVSDTITVRNGGVFFIYSHDATGYGLTATTADLLKFLNNDGSNVATYKVAIIGASA